MVNARNLRYLQAALLLFGAVFLIVYPLMYLWPSGWRWEPSQIQYEQMIVGVYATLGLFLLKAARKPMENLSLIWFTVWSSVVHATIMLLQVFFDPIQHGHLYGDIPALYLVAIVLGFLIHINSTKKLL